MTAVHQGPVFAETIAERYSNIRKFNPSSGRGKVGGGGVDCLLEDDLTKPLSQIKLDFLKGFASPVLIPPPYSRTTPVCANEEDKAYLELHILDFYIEKEIL